MRSIFRQPNQDASQNDPQAEEELDAAEPPTDVASIQGPLIVSPTTARDFMLDLHRSAEDAVSIANDLALNDVPKSSPESPVQLRGKRKRQEARGMDRSPNKRVAKGRKINEAEDEPPATSTNGITGFGSRPSRASSDVKETPGKLPRPKKEQQKRHMAQIYPARSGDFWELQPSPVKQVGKPDMKSKPSRRGRGRPKGSVSPEIE